MKRDKNNIANYYKAWENFDVDNEIENIEKEDKNKKPAEKIVNPYEVYSSNKPKAAAKSKIVIKGGRQGLVDINSIKD